MALQFSVAVRNVRLDAIDTLIGASAILMIRTLAPPVNCAAADAGVVLSTVNLPVNWMNPAAGGIKTYIAVWQDLLADASGVAGHFRVYDNGLLACHMQGTVTATGGGGDMTVDNINFAVNQSFTITQFTLTDGNA
jgi:hypothetical protein